MMRFAQRVPEWTDLFILLGMMLAMLSRGR